MLCRGKATGALTVFASCFGCHRCQSHHIMHYLKALSYYSDEGSIRTYIEQKNCKQWCPVRMNSGKRMPKGYISQWVVSLAREMEIKLQASVLKRLFCLCHSFFIIIEQSGKRKANQFENFLRAFHTSPEEEGDTISPGVLWHCFSSVYLLP